MKQGTCIIGAAAFAGVLLSVIPREARADVALAGDFDLGVPVDQTPQRYLGTGAGFDFRAGYRLRIPYQHIAVTPELAAGYTDLAAHLVRIRPGLRVGIGRLLVPYAYAHFGWGFASFDPLGTRDTSPNPPSVSSHGMSFDFGAGLDVTILRRLTVGAHIGYNVMNVGTTERTPLDWRAKWMSFGLNATFYFGR